MGEDLGDYEIGLLLRRAHRKAAEAFNDALKPLDVQGRHFGVLLLLRRLGPLSQRQIMDHLGSDKSAMVRTIDDLEAADLCVRKPAEHDRRAHAVALTPHGEEVFTRVERVARAVGKNLLADFDPAERAQLTKLLARFVGD